MGLAFPIRLKLPITFLVRKLIGKKIKNTDGNRDFLTKKFSYPEFSCTLVDAQLYRPLSAWWRRQMPTNSSWVESLPLRQTIEGDALGHDAFVRDRFGGLLAAPSSYGGVASFPALGN